MTSTASGFDANADRALRWLDRVNKARAASGRRALSMDEARRRDDLLRELDEINRTGGPDERPRRDEIRERLALLDDPEIRKARPKRPEECRRVEVVSVVTTPTPALPAPRDGKLAAAGQEREPWTPPQFPDDDIPF